jgi:hypothetical protein
MQYIPFFAGFCRISFQIGLPHGKMYDMPEAGPAAHTLKKKSCRQASRQQVLKRRIAACGKLNMK